MNKPFFSPGTRLAALSLCLNFLLTGGKLALYLYTNSSAILAETVHSLTDVVGSLLIILGIYLSERKSESFPWGLYKAENIAAAFSSLMIFLSAYEIGKTIFSPSAVEMRNLDLSLIILFSMAVPIILFLRYETKEAKASNSPALIADAEHWRMDLAPLAVVSAGIAGIRIFSLPFIERIAASAILVLVVKAGYGILKDAMRGLLDASVDRKTLDELRRTVEGYRGVKEIISLQARNSGKFIFVYIAITLSSKRLRAAHEIADAVEAEIKKKFPFVERVTIHYEPERKGYRRYAAPVDAEGGRISEHFSKAPLIAVWDVRDSDSTAISEEMLKNPFLELKKGRGIKLAELLVQKEIDILYTREDFGGKGPAYVISDAEVELRKTDINTLKELMARG